MQDGFLDLRCADRDVLADVGAWHGDGKLELAEDAREAYDATLTVRLSARRKGLDAYAALNRGL